jgi:transcriptional regulator with GAF, ATPase, and Fis domain
VRGKLRAIATASGRDEVVFERLFGTLREVLPVKALATVSFEEEPDALRGTDVEKVTAVLSGETRLPRADLLAWVTKTADPNGLHEAPARQLAAGSERTIVLNAAFPYQVVLPLQTPEVITGLLVLESDDAALHEPELVQQLTQLADHVALSVQDRSLRRQMQAVNERLQSRAEALHRILDVSNELKSHLTLDHVIQNIVRAASASLGWDVVLLSLYDRAENVFVRRAHVGLDEAWDALSKENLPREEVVKWFAERHRISKSYFISHVEQQLSPEDSSARAARRRKGLAANAGPLLRPAHGGRPDLASSRSTSRAPASRPGSGHQRRDLRPGGDASSRRAYETTRQLSVRDSLPSSAIAARGSSTARDHRHERTTSPSRC